MSLWEGLLFAPQSPAVLALFRVTLALVLLADSVRLVRTAPLVLHPDGIYDPATARRAPPGHRLNLFSVLAPTVGTVRLVLVVHVAALVALGLGALTPLAAGIVFVTLASVHNRNPMVLNSADAVARLLVFWLILAPAGQVLALDVVWFDLDPQALADPWALRLLQFQVLVVYLRTAWWKLRGAEWRAGTAVWFALSSPDLRRHGVPRALAGRPGAYRFATWSTVALELGFPVLVWVGPLRYPMLVTMAGFHLAMHWFLRIRLFPWVMLAGLVLFLPPDDVSRWLVG